MHQQHQQLDAAASSLLLYRYCVITAVSSLLLHRCCFIAVASTSI